jgi:hypothetical protein
MTLKEGRDAPQGDQGLKGHGRATLSLKEKWGPLSNFMRAILPLLAPFYYIQNIIFNK